MKARMVLGTLVGALLGGACGAAAVGPFVTDAPVTSAPTCIRAAARENAMDAAATSTSRVGIDLEADDSWAASDDMHSTASHLRDAAWAAVADPAISTPLDEAADRYDEAATDIVGVNYSDTANVLNQVGSYLAQASAALSSTKVPFC